MLLLRDMVLYLRSFQKTMLILSTLDTRYLESDYRHVIRIQSPQKPPIRVSTKYVVILRETPGDDVDIANLWRRETTLIIFTLGTGYLEERCRRYIRVHQPRKLPSNEFRLIMFQIVTKLQETINTVYPGHQVLLRVLP
ncbi:hypothetical protein TSAR_000205 [Trichomalopsis sarcophagae]|uniref:Uncharacterized protein n=1 Tax=Trichomalopsis sarcophagae TaxID=543379 RepID=A0A232FE80_9HYME|nr:hypothetical protein TSAR_000205 [Trichomalopsis sarcophagae]